MKVQLLQALSFLIHQVREKKEDPKYSFYLFYKNSDKIQLNNFDDNLTELSEESIDPISEIVYYLKGKTLKKEVYIIQIFFILGKFLFWKFRLKIRFIKILSIKYV